MWWRRRISLSLSLCVYVYLAGNGFGSDREEAVWVEATLCHTGRPVAAMLLLEHIGGVCPCIGMREWECEKREKRERKTETEERHRERKEDREERGPADVVTEVVVAQFPADISLSLSLSFTRFSFFSSFWFRYPFDVR
jgi:hypothetical protein